MKKIFLITAVITTVIFTACKKDGKEKTENICPIVAASAVPQLVKDSFSLRYPSTNVITWFNKDSVAFCAYFKTSANLEILAQFANNGIFVKEEIDTNQHGQHEDNTGTFGKSKVGCECEPHSISD